MSNYMTEQEKFEAEELIKESQEAYKDRDFERVIELLRQASALGDDLAMETLGEIYKNGDMEVDEDMKLANYWFLKAAAHGSVYAMEQLAKNYYSGDGVREDEGKSAKYFQMAADNGSTYGCYRTADLYYYGECYEQDYSKALEYLKKAVDPNAKVKSWNNSSEFAAALRLGEMYEEGIGVAKDLDQSIEWYKQSVKFNSFNSINAFRRLMNIYKDSKSDLAQVFYQLDKRYRDILKLDDNENYHNDIRYLIEFFLKILANSYKDERFNNEILEAQIVPMFKDKAEAANLIYRLKKIYDKSVEKIIASGEDLESEEDIETIKNNLIHLAVELGQPEAMFRFGDYFYNIAPDSAFKWQLKAAELGNADSMAQYGYNFDWDDNVEEELKWYRKGAELGSANAMALLGNKFYIADPPDYKSALEWYNKAAKLGHMGAMNALGEMYRDGEGVDKDLNLAFKWFKAAAELGHHMAQLRLAICYVCGYGTEPNEDEAYKWVLAFGREHYSSNFKGEAMDDMGNIYRDCLGNKAKAFEYFLKGAELGCDDSMFSLAKMYSESDYVEKDETKVFEYLLKSAKAGHIFAVGNIIGMYMEGIGTEKNMAEALWNII